MKDLDTQNFLLISEKIKHKKEMSELKAKNNKEIISIRKISIEYENVIKLLLKKVIKMKNEKIIFDAEKKQFKTELEDLNECFIKIKEII